MTSPELYSVQAEYRSSPVPGFIPDNRSSQVEYKYDPKYTGILRNGIAATVFSLAIIANVPQISQITPADLLAYAEVNTNSNFNAENLWRYIIVQYRHRTSGQIVNIVHRKVGAVWTGYLNLISTSATGTWVKRSTIIEDFNGNELILLPTRFQDGESLVIQA